MNRSVAVVGGGITGSVAARRMAILLPGVRIRLLERDDRLGGKILTQEIAGVPVEAGADWFLTRQPAAHELCRELGLAERLVPPRRTGAYIWSKEGLKRIPPGMVRGVPTDPIAPLRTGALSGTGALRTLVDLVASGPLRGPDISVGALVRRRFGGEVLERLVDPLLAASRSGDPDELSLSAAAPEIDAAARAHKSVMVGLRKAAARAPTATAPPFLGLRGGMSLLVDALRDDMKGAEVSTGVEAGSMERRGNRYSLRANGEDLDVDAVVLALPAYAASDLVRAIDETLAGELRGIAYSPAIVATLAYPPGAGSPPPDGSGLLVPSSEEKLLTACAWFSEKWDHARPPDGSLVLRCFVARPGAADLTDDDLVEALSAELREALGLAGPPRDWRVVRWDAALPVYRVGHPDLLRRIERRLELLPGIEVAGAGYRGSGLPDCILQAERAARRVAAFLDPKGKERASLAT